MPCPSPNQINPGKLPLSVGAVGTLQYIGPVKTSTGPRGDRRPLVAGVALPTAAGEHNGTDDGGYHFKCSRVHGVTCPAYKVSSPLNRTASSH